MVQQPTLGAQQRVTPREVAGELGESDVLEHADRADGVVRTVVDVAEVGVAHLDPVAQPALGDALARELGLGFGERHAHRVDAVVLGRVEHHAAPPAPDVEEPHPWLEVELAADELVLVRLRVLERGGVVVPDRARVGERRTEHHPVEVVRHVVVVRDGGGVAHLGSGAGRAAGPLRAEAGAASGPSSPTSLAAATI